MGGHGQSHQLPKSFRSHFSHGQTSSPPGALQREFCPTLIPACPCLKTTASTTATPLPAQLLPHKTPAAFQGCQALQSNGLPTDYSFSSSSRGVQNIPGLLPSTADGKSGWQKLLARKTAGGCIPPGTAPSLPAGNCREAAFLSESKDNKK